MLVILANTANGTTSNSRAEATQMAFRSAKAYCAPDLVCVGHALDLILEKAECKSKQVAERVRRMIDESGGSLLFSPADAV